MQRKMLRITRPRQHCNKLRNLQAASTKVAVATAEPVLDERESGREAGTACGSRLTRHGAAMSPGDGLDQRQPQTNAAVVFSGTGRPKERLEDSFPQMLGNSGAAIADIKLRGVRVRQAQ
jgi:hypothetical protein